MALLYHVPSYLCSVFVSWLRYKGGSLPNLHVTPSNLKTSGDTVTWHATVAGDRFRQIGMDLFDIMAEAVVKGGKIISFAITQPPEMVSKFQKAMAQGGSAGH